MKGKEEDEERNENICLQTDNQVNKQSLNSNTEATLILCGSSGERANILTIFHQYSSQCVSVHTHNRQGVILLPVPLFPTEPLYSVQFRTSDARSSES